jgi:hypothetical protein
LKQALERPFFVAPPKDRFSSSLTSAINKLTEQANADVTIGAVLVAAPTIKVHAQFHHVAGTAAIKDIIAPSGFTGGAIHLIPDGLWTTVTGGNIGVATTAVVGKVLALIFDGAMYWPSY